MKIALFAVAVALALTGNSHAQRKAVPKRPAPKKAAEPAVPKKIADELKPILAKIKETPAEVVEKRPGEFVKQKDVATEVRGEATISDYADKPYTANISWLSSNQETKIYGDKQRAEQSNDWLAVGRVAGNSYAMTGSVRYTAVFWHVDGKWKLEGISSFSEPVGNLSAADRRLVADHDAKARKFREAKWSKVFAEVDRKETKD